MTPCFSLLFSSNQDSLHADKHPVKNDDDCDKLEAQKVLYRERMRMNDGITSFTEPLYPCTNEQSEADVTRNGSLGGCSRSSLWQPSVSLEDGDTYVESSREQSTEPMDIDEVLSPTTIPSQDLRDGLEQKPVKRGVLGKLRRCFAPRS